MSIEQGVSASSSKTIAGVESTASKGSVKPGAKKEGTDAGGFSGILALMGVSSVAEPSTVATEALPDPLASKDTPLSTTDVGVPDVPPLPLFDASVFLAQKMPTSLMALPTQAGDGVDADALLPASTTSFRWPASTTSLGSQTNSVQSTNASLETATLFGSLLEPLLKTKVKDVGLQGGDALLTPASQVASNLLTKTKNTETQWGATALLAARQAALADAPILSSTLIANGMGDSLLRQSNQETNKPSTLTDSAVTGSTWDSRVLLTEKSVETASVMADPSKSFEQGVADTVSYWVTQGVQNAELKLDGFGGESVQVSISLKGDEAQIDFRTDQPEVRELLESATTQLKDMLVSEGLVLSGVFIGGSAQHGAGGQERRNRPDLRQVVLPTTEQSPVEHRPGTAQSVGRTLDLFV